SCPSRERPATSRSSTRRRPNPLWSARRSVPVASTGQSPSPTTRAPMARIPRTRPAVRTGRPCLGWYGSAVLLAVVGCSSSAPGAPDQGFDLNTVDGGAPSDPEPINAAGITETPKENPSPCGELDGTPGVMRFDLEGTLLDDMTFEMSVSCSIFDSIV